MADRFLLKQFAGQADNNGVFGSAQQGQGQVVSDLKQVQSLNSFENGWNSATVTGDKLPCLEEFQGVSALAYKAIKELYSEGIPQWLSTETYYKDSFAIYNGKLYVNTTGSYTTNNPAIDTTNWSDYSEIVKNALNDYFVRTTGNQDIAGIKTFTNKIYQKNNLDNSDINLVDENLQSSTEIPEQRQLRMIRGRANNNDIFGELGFALNTDGKSNTYLLARKVINGSSVDGVVHIYVDNDGNVSTSAPNPPANSNDTSIATTSWVRSVAGGGIPTGTILPFGGADDAIPNGYLLCNGGQISRTTYANLFAVIGTAYGAGDGSSTFNLPNLINRYLGGNGNGYLSESLPQHTHNYAVPSYGVPTSAGNWYVGSNGTYATTSGGANNSVYQENAQVRPFTTLTNFIIKY